MAAFQIMRQLMSDNLSIGLRSKLESLVQLRLLELSVILDDAVVDYGNASVTDVRVSIFFRWCPVSGPARMRYSQKSLKAVRWQGGFEFGNLANLAYALQPAGVNNRDACRVIAAIFQPFESLKQYRRDIALRDCADDATHVRLSFLINRCEL